MTTEKRPRPAVPEDAGLCAGCAHMRLQVNDRDSVFLRCALAAHDARFPKYPPLPVADCAGYRPVRTEPEARYGTETRGSELGS